VYVCVCGMVHWDISEDQGSEREEGEGGEGRGEREEEGAET